MSNETYINTGTSFQQPFNDRRPVQQSYQYNNQESKRRPVRQSYQYNNVETRRRPSRQTYQYNNVETRQRPARQTYQYNNTVTRQRPARQSYQYHNRVQQNTQQTYTYHNRVQQNTQQTYTYHNRVSRQRPARQSYQYHNRVQQNTQQTYTYHNRVQQNTQQPYQYHNRIQTTTQQTYTYHNRVQQNTQQTYTYHNRVQQNTQQEYQVNFNEFRRRPVRNQAHTNFIHYMRVYGGGGDSVAVKMETPYGQALNIVPSFEFTPTGADEQRGRAAGQFPFPYQQGGTTVQRSGNLHEGDSFRGAMFFRGPNLNFQANPAAPQAGTGSPYYEGAGNQLVNTNANSWNFSGINGGFGSGQVQRQYQTSLRYIGQNTIFAADIIASPTSQNQSVPNPQRQGHPQGQGNQGAEFLSQHPSASQYAIKVNSGQSVRLGWENVGSYQSQVQNSPNFPAGREPLFVRGSGDFFTRTRSRNYAHQQQFTVGTYIDWVGVGEPNPSPILIGYINEKQQPAQQLYGYHTRQPKRRPVRVQRNQDEDRRRPVRVQVNSEETRRRPTRVQELQRVSRRRPARVQVNAVETRRRPTRVQVNVDNQVQRSIQQTYTYHNRLSRQRPVQQIYTYHNQIPRRRPVRQPFPSTRTIGPLAKVKQIWINDGGVLRKMDEVYVNNSGNLKKTHQSVPTSQLTDPNT